MDRNLAWWDRASPGHGNLWGKGGRRWELGVRGGGGNSRQNGARGDEVQCRTDEGEGGQGQWRVARQWQRMECSATKSSRACGGAGLSLSLGSVVSVASCRGLGKQGGVVWS
eukprot:1873354-Rhodomonas_salina.5